MGVVLAPIPNDKVAEWKTWMAELTGPRHAELEDFNRRHGLTKHEAWFCETPMGAAVVAIHEGPGSADFMPKVAVSSHAFDLEFRTRLQSIHGMDLSKPPPGPMPVKVLG